MKGRSVPPRTSSANTSEPILVGWIDNPSAPSGRTDFWYSPHPASERWWIDFEIDGLRRHIYRLGGVVLVEGTRA